MKLQSIYNPFMKMILRSPLHGLISKNIMLITFTGSKSGKLYTTPVNYVREGDRATVVSFRHRKWWRNLRGGAPVTLRLRGQELAGVAKAIEGEEAVAASLLAHLQRAPHYARYFDVALDPDGKPNPEGVARAAKNRVVIQIQLAGS